MVGVWDWVGWWVSRDWVGWWVSGDWVGWWVSGTGLDGGCLGLGWMVGVWDWVDVCWGQCVWAWVYGGLGGRVSVGD